MKYWILYQYQMASDGVWRKRTEIIDIHPIEWEKNKSANIRYGFETLYILLNWKEL